MARKRKKKRTAVKRKAAAKPKRAPARRKKAAAKRRTRRPGIAERIADAIQTLTGAADDAERLRRKMRHRGMDEG